MSGNMVIEKTTWSNLPGLIISREVHPNGSGKLIISENGHQKISAFSGVDYSLFTEWVKNAPSLLGNTGNHNNVAPLGSDITGSQYKHVYISTTGPITYKRVDMSTWQSLADVYEALAIAMVHIPSVVISGYAQVIVHKLAASPAKVTVTTGMYEVFLVMEYIIHIAII